jgi:LmbE family N-acetylglucosaminyl deacetylase
MAYDGILKCFGSKQNYFTGVVTTNGCGSPRNGIYADYTDEELQVIRKQEQKKAAIVGDYSALLFLDYSSSVVKSKDGSEVIENFKKIIINTQPKYIYTHNLADKHDTHVSVVVKLIKALRELNYMPKGFYGCEVWRDLDWLNDSDKVKFNVSGRINLINALLGVFDSQIAGGKRYDLATSGRWVANATYSESHGVDDTDALMFAMDLLPLLEDKELDIAEFAIRHINNFASDVRERIRGREIDLYIE